MINDFFVIFYWWILLFGLGVIFLPLTLRLFPKFFDKGYGFSKVIGILIISYVVWLLGSLKVLQFVPEAVWLVVLAGVAVNLKGIKARLASTSEAKSRRGLKGIKEIWRTVLFEEVLFFAALALWSFIRGFQPDIHGLEKFMDFGFVNSILRSKYFPPKDMWFAGSTINYYYFGHLMSAVLTKLSGLDAAITYNLMIATVFALTFTATFSLGGNLINSKPEYRNSKQIRNSNDQMTKTFRASDFVLRILPAGLLSAFLLTLSGNLHTLWWFLKHRTFTGYWYPDATRFIVELFGAADNTIHEFPLYSWVVADLHGHMINIPTVLLILALLLNLKTESRKRRTDRPQAAIASRSNEDRKLKAEKSTLRHLFSSIRPLFSTFSLLSLGLATTFMTNPWDFPIYLLVTGLVLLGTGIKGIKGVKEAAAVCGGLAIGSVLLGLPFHLNFQNIAQGIALTDFHSPPWMLLVLWGFPLFVTTRYLIFRRNVVAGLVPAQREGDHPPDFACERTRWRAGKGRNYITILLAVAWLLVLVPEIIYIKDIYIHSYQRANTMFKLTYQSFIMFSLAGGYIIVTTLTNLKRKPSHFLYAVTLFALLIFVFIYPFYAVKSYYGLQTYRGLDGLQWLEQQYPDDFEAVTWLKENVKGQPVILEAVGESYTDFARVSANTGLPTVCGWTVHEWLWRGSYDEPGKRDAEVRKIYESANMEETKGLLLKYEIEYIYVGSLERQKYAGLGEEKFAKIGEVVFENKGVRVYHLDIDKNF